MDRTGPSVQDVQEFERTAGVALPNDYVRFLRQSNGGCPVVNGVGHEWSVDNFYHLSEDRDAWDSLWRVHAEWRSTVGDGIIPIADDGGGNQIVLDCRTYPVAVFVCIHDDDFRMVPLARTFEEFIDKLIHEPDV